MAYKVIVTLPGYDVATATPEQCAIHSDYPSPKMEEDHVDVEPYTFAGVPASDTTLFTIAHGYSYIPAALVYVDVPASIDPGGVGGQYPLPFVLTYSGTPDVILAHSDATNLYIEYKRNGTAPALTGVTINFKYYIFVEDGL